MAWPKISGETKARGAALAGGENGESNRRKAENNGINSPVVVASAAAAVEITQLKIYSTG
jgi:hypothetical protein